MRLLRIALTTAVLLAAVSPLRAEWNPALAARYLDARQQAWFDWKTAQSSDGPCVSCHTGMTYLLARPVLRRALNEAGPTPFEIGYLNRLRTKMAKPAEGTLGTVEAVMSAMFFSRDDARNTMSSHTRQAFDRLWESQESSGPQKGGWQWYEANLDPWENPESGYYGASLVALALSQTPAAYRSDASVRTHAGALTAYLAAPAATPRLHDRLALLWASASLPGLLSDSARQALIAEIVSRQQADGGWTLAGLGPWMTHPDPPPSSGSHAYATAFTAFVLQRAGVPPSNAALTRAVAWLRSRQDPATGAWPAVSMNKKYPDGSMMSLFMQDAATAFASIVLVEADVDPARPKGGQ
jgi:squalene-hopene/tetraprenyl-beta-curcumene cyclase